MFACIYRCGERRRGEGDSARALHACAAGFAPTAELTDPGTVVFDVSRLNRLYGSLPDLAAAIRKHAESLGLDANIAIAPNAEAAILAAHNFKGVTVIPDDAEAAVSQLDLARLPLDAEMGETLASWGIRTVGDLARLPENGLAARLGKEAVYLRQLARGQAERPLRVAQPEMAFEERVDLEHPLTVLEPLFFLISRILNDQCAQLQAHGLAAVEMRLTLGLEDKTEHCRELRLPLPMRQSKALLKLAQLDLEAHPPQAPVMAVALALKPAQPRTAQSGLFLPATPPPDKLEITLARIRGIVGERNVGVPELLNTHRPGAFRLALRQPAVALEQARRAETRKAETRVAFRYFTPPLSAKVELQGGHPLRLAAGAIRGNVITCAGPWRSSGDWWTEGPWNRDEWDVSLNDGGIYRIYHEPGAAWFVEGVYD